jgi:hypothetical protein
MMIKTFLTLAAFAGAWAAPITLEPPASSATLAAETMNNYDNEGAFGHSRMLHGTAAVGTVQPAPSPQPASVTRCMMGKGKGCSAAAAVSGR